MIKKSCFFILFLIIMHFNLLRGENMKLHNLKCYVNLEKVKIIYSEPLFLTIKYHNVDTKIVKLNLGNDDIGNISFKIFDNKGKIIQQGTPIVKFGFSPIKSHSISPNNSFIKKIILNRWCSTKLQNGRYKLETTIRLNATQQYKFTNDFTIKEKNKSLLEKIANNYIQKINNSQSENDKLSASKALIYLNTANSIKFKMSLIKNNRSLPNLKKDYIQSFKDNPSLEVVEFLISAYLNTSIKNEQKNTIKDVIIDINKNSKQDKIIKITSRIIKKHNLSKESTIID